MGVHCLNDIASDILSLIGLSLTLIGAGITARAVILREDDAIHIGVPRWASDQREENLKLPMVKNLLWSSMAAKYGLVLICAGTVFQALPIILRLAQ